MDYFLYNKEILPTNKHHISGNNRGFLYGDGIFETLIVQENRVSYLNDHLERIRKGAEAFSIEVPDFLDHPFLLNTIQQLIHLNQPDESFRIRINLWRKPGGLFTPSNNSGELTITMQNYIFSGEDKYITYFYEGGKKSLSTISAFKTLSAAHYVLASIEKSKLKADEMILTDVFDNISECTASNIFFIKDYKLYTPSLECACIEGIVRKQIVKLCGKFDIPLETGKYTKKTILNADFVFSSNVSQIATIRKIENVSFAANNKLFDRLLQLIKEDQIATAAFI